jgi:hypothetical protein
MVWQKGRKNCRRREVCWRTWKDETGELKEGSLEKNLGCEATFRSYKLGNEEGPQGEGKELGQRNEGIKLCISLQNTFQNISRKKALGKRRPVLMHKDTSVILENIFFILRLPNYILLCLSLINRHSKVSLKIKHHSL